MSTDRFVQPSHDAFLFVEEGEIYDPALMLAFIPCPQAQFSNSSVSRFCEANTYHAAIQGCEMNACRRVSNDLASVTYRVAAQLCPCMEHVAVQLTGVAVRVRGG